MIAGHSGALEPPCHPPPVSIVIAEHQPRSLRRYIPPVKAVWITVRPNRRWRLELIDGRDRVIVRTVVTFHF